MSDSVQIEKSIQQQVIEKMISKLNGQEDFPESVLSNLGKIDLCSKSDVIDTISKLSELKEDENTET